MENKVSESKFAKRFLPRKILLYCGLISSILYVITDLIACSLYPGYSIADQNYSELLATGAPTRIFLLIVCVFYNLLVVAFAIGILNAKIPGRSARITGISMIAYAALSMITPAFFQMDMRGAEVTTLGSLHPPMTAIMSIFILLSLGFGAFISYKWFRYYSFTTIVIVCIFGLLTSLQVPELSANLPTPWMGLKERVNIYLTMLWFAVASITLLQKPKE